jgi:cysteinyl-tRNA synthetase
MPDDNLTKDDLVLLMESYRNMIIMHQTILDQSTKTIEKLDIIATKQEGISTKQGNICSSLSKITNRLDDCATVMKDSNINISGMSTKITDKINTHEKKSIEDHGKITNKIYLGWIGMGTIIIGLIGLTITITKILQHTHVLP